MQVPRQLLTASILDFKTLSYYFNENQFSGFKDVSDMPDKFDTTLQGRSYLYARYARAYPKKLRRKNKMKEI